MWLKGLSNRHLPSYTMHSLDLMRSFTAQNAQQYLTAYFTAYTSTNNAYDITLLNAMFYRLVSAYRYCDHIP